MLRVVVKRLTQPSTLGLLTGLLILPAAWVGCSSSSDGNKGTGGAPGGTGGAGGSTNVCTVPSGSVTSCASPTKPSNAFLSDFSASSWMNAAGKWGVCGNLLGALNGYQGSMALSDGGTSSVTAVVDVPNNNLVVSGNVAANDYGGGIMAFATCGDLTAYTGVQFTLGGTGTAGCDLQLQLQTWSQQDSKYGGGCDAAVNTCYGFPKVTLPFAAGVTTVKFADLVGTGMPSASADFLKETIGFQWHFQAGGTGECAGINVTIDDVKLTTN